MPEIVEASGALHSKRRSEIRRLIAPLMPQPPNLTIQQVGFSRDAFTLAAVPNGRNPASIVNPEEALVPTKLPRVLLNYFETWKLSGRSDAYYLDRAYLHVHLALSKEPMQVLALHCDPSMSPSEVHYRYRRGPHLHIYGAQPDIGRSHISVCLRDSELGGIDLNSLTLGLREAVEMIVVEMLPTWDRALRL